MVFLLFTDVVFNVLDSLLYSLPLMVMFAKFCNVHNTSFLTGSMNFGSSSISPGIGTWINYKWVGVNKRDLSNYSTLVLI